MISPRLASRRGAAMINGAIASLNRPGSASIDSFAPSTTLTASSSSRPQSSPSSLSPSQASLSSTSTIPPKLPNSDQSSPVLPPPTPIFTTKDLVEARMLRKRLHDLLANQGWELTSDGTGIEKVYVFRNHKEAVYINHHFNDLTTSKTTPNHHPSLAMLYNRIYLLWTTHRDQKTGLAGISLNDITMAQMFDKKIDDVLPDHIHGRRVQKEVKERTEDLKRQEKERLRDEEKQREDEEQGKEKEQGLTGEIMLENVRIKAERISRDERRAEKVDKEESTEEEFKQVAARMLKRMVEDQKRTSTTSEERKS